MAEDDTAFPIERTVRERTPISVEHSITVNLPEEELFAVEIEARGRGMSQRARVIGAYLEWYWTFVGDEQGWHFSRSGSRVVVQRATLDGWGSPVRRAWIDSAETAALRTQYAPKGIVEVVIRDR